MSAEITAWLDDTQAKSDAATEGPWSATHGQREHARVWASDDDVEPVALLLGFIDPDDARGTAAFIADARTRLPQAIAALREIRQFMADQYPPFMQREIDELIAGVIGVQP